MEEKKFSFAVTMLFDLLENADFQVAFLCWNYTTCKRRIKHTKVCRFIFSNLAASLEISVQIWSLAFLPGFQITSFLFQAKQVDHKNNHAFTSMNSPTSNFVDGI
ncbi:hypothetical protein KFK09_013051 [Dendrobium nobile]|uniref:Uncharacterized protein n=1 Tax=Dendrobium nobile TaxID=94219 RepID=A0A8T3BH71_DENNO|nr:hypothetical protein KFK09_013051 [Dendrobium nobile]